MHILEKRTQIKCICMPKNLKKIGENFIMTIWDEINWIQKKNSFPFGQKHVHKSLILIWRVKTAFAYVIYESVCIHSCASFFNFVKFFAHLISFACFESFEVKPRNETKKSCDGNGLKEETIHIKLNGKCNNF